MLKCRTFFITLTPKKIIITYICVKQQSMNRIFLIGYMGAGKTTAGKELASVLNLEFVDLDLYIQSRLHKTINQLFEEHGENGFREIENKLLKEVADFENVVISTGGGAPCFFDNMEHMNNSGKTIYLQASPQILSDRLNLNKDKRPLLKDKTKEELYKFVCESLEKREPFYTQAQHIYPTDNVISTDINRFTVQMIDALKLKQNL